MKRSFDCILTRQANRNSDLKAASHRGQVQISACAFFRVEHAKCNILHRAS